MATKLFFRDDRTDDYHATVTAKKNGSASVWTSKLLSTTRGASATSDAINSVAGPTNGIEVDTSIQSYPIEWITPPLAGAVTISGSITWNLRAAEFSMSDNCAVNGRIEKIDGATGALTLIDQTSRTTEVALSEAANNFAETPASGVACLKGDRLRVIVYFDDAGTMAVGGPITFWYDGPTDSASGDSYVTLTEDLSFVTTPAGTTIYPTNTASAVSTSDVDREAWTSRGAGVQSDVTNTAAGPTAPIQVTDTAGGTAVSWFTRQLNAFTLSGAVEVNLRANASLSATADLGVEIARVDNDGTNATVWATGLICRSTGTEFPNVLDTVEGVHNGLVSGNDLAISGGQRLRIRLFIDDPGVNMPASRNATIYYAGTSGGASGDMYLTFTQTLTEGTGGAASTVPKGRHHHQVLSS